VMASTISVSSPNASRTMSLVLTRGGLVVGVGLLFGLERPPQIATLAVAKQPRPIDWRVSQGTTPQSTRW
jgi:hypothetical protein